MPEIFSYSFMQRGFLVGNVIGLVVPLIGVFLNLKRLSLIGHTLSHVALAGVALGIFLGIYPVPIAIVVAVCAAIGIEKLRHSGYRGYAELSLAIILASGLGMATILISLSDSNVAIYSYLFGSISLVTRQDLLVIIPLGAIIALGVGVFYYGFFFVAFNEEEAKLSGVPVKLFNTIFMIMVAIVVALSMRIIGGLLISSLIVLPVAAALQIARSFKETVFFSMLFGVVSVNAGLILSFYWDLAPGGTIILGSVCILLLTFLIKGVKKALERKELGLKEKRLENG